MPKPANDLHFRRSSVHFPSGSLLYLLAVLAWVGPGLAAAAPPANAPTTAPARDSFGIAKLFPTRPGGREYAADWSRPRTFTGQDPNDPWFDADHGDGQYTVDGHGTLTAVGPIVRMYVHDPDKQREWDENLEITVYVTRREETRLVSYSGLQIFARTNHGTLGNENQNLCDDRGYGAKVTIDGRWEFEKETAHHAGGYVSAGSVKPWSELPKNTPVGVKYVLRNTDGDTKVKLELYRDLSGGREGGQWEKMTEWTDTGDNFGRNAAPPAPGVKPELPLIRAAVLPNSESHKPMLTVYFRHEYGTMAYSRLSIREIGSVQSPGAAPAAETPGAARKS